MRALRTALRHVLWTAPRRVLVRVVAFPRTPEPVRRRLAAVLGVRSALDSFPRGLVLDNARVTFAQGAVVGDGCRFEGGAAIRVGATAVLPPRSVVSTRAELDGIGPPSVFDVPLTIDGSIP